MKPNVFLMFIVISICFNIGIIVLYTKRLVYLLSGG